MVLRTFALALGLLLGVAASQWPEFAQQYRQRLGGALDEMRAVVARFEGEARAQGLEPEAAAERLRANADPLAADRGRAAAADMSRARHLERQYAAMTTAPPFTRLASFARDAEPAMAAATFRDFEPAVPVTSEGLVLGGLGFLTGYLGPRLLGVLFRRRRRRTRGPRIEPAVEPAPPLTR